MVYAGFKKDVIKCVPFLFQTLILILIVKYAVIIFGDRYIILFYPVFILYRLNYVSLIFYSCVFGLTEPLN